MPVSTPNFAPKSIIAALIASLLAVTGLVAGVAPAAAAQGEGLIRVHVVRDYDGNGSQDPAIEVRGVEGLAVTLEDASADAGAGGVVDAVYRGDGWYELDPGTLAGGTYRVRTEIPPELGYLWAAPAGGENGTEPVFAPLVTDVPAQSGTVEVLQGVWNPYDYVSPEGYRLAVGEQSGDPRHTSTSVVTYDPTPGFVNGIPLTKTQSARWTDVAETGSTSGVAWDRFGEQMFVGSAVKRHTLFGPGGSGAIYRIVNGGDWTTWATLPAGPAEHDANLDEDYDIFEAVGKQGLGDLQTSENGTLLYVVNLYDKKLYIFDTSNPIPGVLVGEPIPIPVPQPILDDGRSDDWRPYALAVRDGVLYVGGVDSAESVEGTDAGRRDALAAYVWTFDESTRAFASAPVLQQPLDFLRGRVYVAGDVPSDPIAENKDNHWNAWRSDWTGFDDFSAPAPLGEPRYLRGPQPLLADLVVDNDGSLILGFKDRTADQFGLDAPVPDPDDPVLVETMAGGDVNRACWVDGEYVWEGSDPVACPNNAAGLPQIPETETYFMDVSGQNGAHREGAKGPLFSLPSEPWVGAVFTESGEGGSNSPAVPRWFDRHTGARYELDTLPSAAIAQGGWGKGNGLGAVAVLADAAIPAQLGNRTWFDANRDGLQTAGEPDLPGVTVQLLDAAGDVQQETTTDEDGLYYFFVDADVPWTVEFDYSTADVSGLAEYGVRTSQDLEWTEAYAEHLRPDGSIDDEIQSRTDEPDGTTALSPVTTLRPGQVDHTLDAGVRVITGSFSLDKIVSGPLLDPVKSFVVQWSIDGDPADGVDAVPQPDIVITAGADPWESGQLPVGSDVVLSEIRPLGDISSEDAWDDPVFSIRDQDGSDQVLGSTATIRITRDSGDDPAVAVTLTNEVVDRGLFSIEKRIETPVGSPIEVGDSEQFWVDVTIGDRPTITVPISTSLGYPSDPIESGTPVTVCERQPTIELDPGFEWADRVLVGPNGEQADPDGCVRFDVGSDATAGLVTVTNLVTLVTGTFTVNKIVSGDDGEHDGQFLVDWAILDAAGVWVTQPDRILVTPGLPTTPGLMLPVGTQVKLTEVTPLDGGLPTDSTWGNPVYSGLGVSPDGTFTIGQGGAVTIEANVTNQVVERGRFTVAKLVSGTGADGVPAEQEFTIEYQIGAGEVMTDTIGVDDPFRSDPIVIGTEVRLRELPAEREFAEGWAAHWDPARYLANVPFTTESAEDGGPDWIVFEMPEDAGVGVTIDNRAQLLLGSFDLTKHVVGAVGDELDVTFTVHYRAEHPSFPGGVREGELTVDPGATVESDLWPVSTSVTLTEITPVGLPDGLVWVGGEFLDNNDNPLAQPFTIAENDETGSAVELQLRNTFQRPEVDIEKGDDGYQGDGETYVNDADTMADGQYYEPGESRTILFVNTNIGTEPLINVVVRDVTTTGGTELQSLQCTFPGDAVATDGVLQADGSWTVFWQQSGSGVPADQRQQWDVDVAFPCSATLTGIDVHADVASVYGTGATSGEQVQDQDAYHAYSASIQLIKYDGEKPDPAIASGDLAIVPDKPLADEWQDANDPEHAVTYPVNAAQRVRWIVTNTSPATWLTDIDLTDRTEYGPAIGDWVCDLSPLQDRDGSSGPVEWSFADGNTYDGIWAPHVSFFCEGPLTLGQEQTHGDTARVEASVVVPAEPTAPGAPPAPSLDEAGVPTIAVDHDGDIVRLSDDDPFHARTPGAPLPTTGADPVWLALLGALILLLGVGGIASAARVRRTAGWRG